MTDPFDPDADAPDELSFSVEPIADDAVPPPPADQPFDDATLERLRADAQARGEKGDARRSFWRELPVLVLVALVVAILIKTFFVQAFFIPSASMRDTLLEGDRVEVTVSPITHEEEEALAVP